MRSHYKFPHSSLPMWACCLGLLTVLVTGCGYPVAEPDNMRLISSLRTALSARNPQWLQANQELIEKRHDEGVMGDEVFESFQAIVEQAREGDWAGAEREAVSFQKAQRPSAEQIARLRERRT